MGGGAEVPRSSSYGTLEGGDLLVKQVRRGAGNRGCIHVEILVRHPAFELRSAARWLNLGVRGTSRRKSARPVRIKGVERVFPWQS